MPSIPQSLLWISLVVLWLFVLVPMLVNKRDTVRRTSDVALATRVLNGTGRATRLLRRRGPATGHRSDPHWRPEPEVDDIEGLDDDDEERTGPVVVTAEAPRNRSVAMVTSLAEEEHLDILDVEVVDENPGAPPVDKVDEPAPKRVSEEPQTEELPLEYGATESEVDGADSVAGAEVAEDAVAQDGEAAEVGEAAEDEPEAEADGTADEYEYVEDSSGLEPEADEPAPVRARSARPYATKTSAAVSARKYRFRTRMLLTMALVLVGSAIAAFLWSPSAWYGCAAMAVITLLYLAYLRRQTRIEERLRQRRVQRLARMHPGVMHAPRSAPTAAEHDVDVVPGRLRRPGAAVLEIDDEDPVFEHLEYASLRREYDLPRASGQ